MISAKNIYNSRAYRQLKAYAKGDNALLKRLVDEYVINFNDYYPQSKFKNTYDMHTSFIWGDTPQGQHYWSVVAEHSDGRK